MTKIYSIFKTQLLLAFVLFGAMISFAQPVIQVPALCNVVVAGSGTGAVTGLGGKVGNNGVVVMPDNFDDPSTAGNFTYVANGTTVVKWVLAGDLSKSTTNIPNAAA
jgi:hypothetical protein